MKSILTLLTVGSIFTLQADNSCPYQGGYNDDQGYYNEDRGDRYYRGNEYYRGGDRGYYRDDRDLDRDRDNIRYRNRRILSDNEKYDYSRDSYRDGYRDGYKDNNELSDDERIRRDVRAALKEGWVEEGYEQIIVRSDKGVVTLEGFVVTSDDKNAIDKRVRNVKGVRDVNNRITVNEAKAREYRR